MQRGASAVMRQRRVEDARTVGDAPPGVVGDVAQPGDGLLEAMRRPASAAGDGFLSAEGQAAPGMAKHRRDVLGAGVARVAQQPAVGLQRGAGAGELEDVLRARRS